MNQNELFKFLKKNPGVKFSVNAITGFDNVGRASVVRKMKKVAKMCEIRREGKGTSNKPFVYWYEK